MGCSSRLQFIDAAVGMTADGPGDDVGEIGMGLDAIELCAFDERCDDGPMLRTAVEPAKRRILSDQGQRPDRALDGVGAVFDATVIKEEAQALPTESA